MFATRIYSLGLFRSDDIRVSLLTLKLNQIFDSVEFQDFIQWSYPIWNYCSEYTADVPFDPSNFLFGNLTLHCFQSSVWTFLFWKLLQLKWNIKSCVWSPDSDECRRANELFTISESSVSHKEEKEQTSVICQSYIIFSREGMPLVFPTEV